MTPILGFSKNSISITINTYDGLTAVDPFTLYVYDLDDYDTPYLAELIGPDLFTIIPGTAGNDTDIRIEVDYTGLDVGNYEYIITATSFGGTVSKDLNVYMNLIHEEEPVIPEDPDYKLKYKITNYDHELDIYENTSDIISPINITGRIELNYEDKNDIFKPIIASNLKIKFFASDTINLQNLYSEEERKFKVILKKNDQVIFIGFIKPDGIWEDYVSTHWELSVDAIDGLSTLKNISFSNNNGVTYSGKYSAFDIIQNCLLKTGLVLPINIFCEIEYVGFLGQSVLVNTLFNTERFFQSETNVMDCEAVLNDVLRVFNLTLIQLKGEWYIYRSIDLNPTTQFARYINGVFVEYFTMNPSVTIGSHIDGFGIFHCNANQRKSIAASYQTYRINYQYGGARSVFRNSKLKLDGSGISIDGWTVNSGPDGDVIRNSNGFGLSTGAASWVGVPPVFLSLNQTVYIQEGSVFNLSIKFENVGVSSGLIFGLSIGDRWLKDDGNWDTTESRIYISNSMLLGLVGKGYASYDATIRAPVNGNLFIKIYRSPGNVGDGRFNIHSINLAGTTDGNIKGRDYTGIRTQKISTVVKPNQTIYNGDSISDLYVGTLYKLNGSPTEFWSRKLPVTGYSEAKEILQINMEDNLRSSPRPMIIFEGDVCGYIPYMSLISINNFDGKKFQPIKYSYDLSSNILKLTSKEYSSEYLSTDDFSVIVENNYGTDSKNTIN